MIDKILLSMFSAAMLLVMPGCGLWSDDTTAVQDPVKHGATVVTPAASDDTELKVAKLWNRVDELEDLLSKQRQRLAVLERGLLLGVIPEELKNPADIHAPKLKEKAPVVELTKSIDAEVEHPAPQSPMAKEAAVTLEADKPEDGRQKTLASAQQFFEQGQYGRAIAIYSAIDDSSDPELAHRYWTALSWYRLKEYDTAQKEFNELIQRAAASQWVPRSQYYLAQIDLEQGLREQALTKLQKLIEQHPDEDAAQMARSTIAKLEKNL